VEGRKIFMRLRLSPSILVFRFRDAPGFRLFLISGILPDIPNTEKIPDIPNTACTVHGLGYKLKKSIAAIVCCAEVDCLPCVCISP
jgi:hypothetical protein